MAKTILSKGIDVSYANGKIDWAKVKSNMDWVIFRVGYGSDYPSQDDAQFANNLAGCEKYEIPYGVYLYSYATDTTKAKSEAAHVLRLLKGHKPAMPVFYDLEESRIAALGKAKILELAKIFCAEIENAGYQYGTYANKNWFTNYLTDKWYDGYPKWVAQYNSTLTYTGTVDIWQYSSTGKIDGINGNVDLNFCYLSFLKGDVDGDGKVTAQDARKILRVSAKLEALDGQDLKNADADGDGDVDAEDARAALRKALGVE